MAGHVQETQGLILFARNHREKDKLVKIFTEKYGKIMFFVKGANRPNNPLTAAILPFTNGNYVGDIRTEGLSFLNTVKEVEPFKKIQQDIFISAYATYILNLVDAAIEDQVYDPALYGFTTRALKALDEEKDPEIITNIFEMQILSRFGIALNWERCAVCGETHGKFDYSSKYSGILCERHWDQDVRRHHADPKAIHFIRMFSAISYEQIQNIHLSTETKAGIRQTIDMLYDEYVGVHLKSKKFIDQMKTWEEKMQIPKQKEPTD